jgi:hypothetical protein
MTLFEMFEVVVENFADVEVADARSGGRTRTRRPKEKNADRAGGPMRAFGLGLARTRKRDRCR